MAISEKNQGGNRTKPKGKDKNLSITKKQITKKKSIKKLNRVYRPTSYSIAYKLLGRSLNFLYGRFPELERNLKIGAVPVPYEAYVCGMVFNGIVVGIISTLLFASFAISMNTDFSIFGIASLGIVLGIIVFVLMYYNPASIVAQRKKNLESEMPYFSGYMATLASSGLTLEGIFKTIAKEKTGEAIVSDAIYITRSLELMGNDIVTALKSISIRSPSEIYSEFFEGIISVVESGGNLTDYFTASSQMQLEARKQKLRHSTTSLAVFAEVYTMVLIVFPLMAAIMLAVMNMLSASIMGFDLLITFKFLTYFFVPFIGTILLFVIGSKTPKR